MKSRDVWAELVVIRNELSRRLYHRRDHAFTFADGAVRSENDWLSERMERLKSELGRRSNA